MGYYCLFVGEDSFRYELDDFPMTRPMISDIAGKLRNDWKRFARHFMNKDHIDEIIDEIDSENKRLDDKILAMMKKMLRKFGELLWKDIKKSLESISRNDIVEHILKTHLLPS